MSFYSALGNLGIQGSCVPAAEGDGLSLELHFIRPSKLFVDKTSKIVSTLLFHLLQVQQPNKSF